MPDEQTETRFVAEYMSERTEHVEWMYREACVRLLKQQREDGAPTKGPWFHLANLIEDLFPDEVTDYRKRMGIEP